MPDKADEIVATQQARITNPDRKRQYAFISPSVSPRQEVRDSVFASLLVAENRRVEPWASAALSNADADSGELWLDLIMVAKYLERIGDHATNVAEWVEYSITGNHPSNN